MSTMVDVTQLYCPASGGQPGDDNSTHPLVPRAGRQTCRACGKTEAQLRDEATR